MLNKLDPKRVVNTKPSGVIPVVKARRIRTLPLNVEHKPLYVFFEPWMENVHTVLEDFTIAPHIVHDCEGEVCPICKPRDSRTSVLRVGPLILTRGDDIFVERALLGKFLDSGLMDDIPDAFFDAMDDMALYEITNHRERWLASPPIYLGAS